MEQKKPLINMNLRWFLLAMILANIAAQMAYSMLSLYLIDLGASVGQVGLAFTVASLIPMLLQLIGGWVSDTIGRLRAIAIGSSIALIGYLLFSISPSWQWVMVGLCVEYVSNSFVGPSFGAYIAEQSEEKSRGRVYGVARGVYMVVTVIGPALGGWVAYQLDFRPMLTIAFCLYAAATAVRLWMATANRFAPKRAAEKPTLSGLKTQMSAMFGLLLAGGILTWIWITDAVSDTSSDLISKLFPIYLSEIGGINVAQIGLVNAAWGVTTIAASFVGGWLTDKWSERAMIASGFLLTALALAGVIVSRSLWGFMAAMGLHGFGFGILMPAYNTLISKVVPENKRGLAFGFFGTSLGILSLPMPWIGAQLWEHISPQTPFWVTVAACAVVVPIVWFKFILKAKENPPVEKEPA